MTKPREYREGTFYAIERRIERGTTVLRPEAIITQLFVYLLCVGIAACPGLSLISVTVMSNHYHLVVYDRGQWVSDFLELVNGTSSSVLRRLRPKFRGSTLWEPIEPSVVALETMEAVIDAIAYAIANPVAAGAVWSPEDWPGLIVTVENLGRRVLRAARPGVWFRNFLVWKSEASVQLELCVGFFEGWDADRVRELVAESLAAKVQTARAAHRAAGKRVRGPVHARNISPYLEIDLDEDGGLNPRVKAGPAQKEALEAALDRLHAFWQRYDEALRRWKDGDRDVVFPYGTYKMRVLHGVRVEPPP